MRKAYRFLNLPSRYWFRVLKRQLQQQSIEKNSIRVCIDFNESEKSRGRTLFMILLPLLISLRYEPMHLPRLLESMEIYGHLIKPDWGYLMT